MAKFTANHDKLYFDTLCRTKKGESVLSLIHATYQAKKNNSDDVKADIATKLKYAYELFKGDAGTYTGDPKQFESQYTIGHELCIWKNSNLDLTELAIQVAENKITIRDYFDIVFLNYIQPVNGNIVHILYHLLEYMKQNGKNSVSKDEMATVYMHVGKAAERGEINGAYNMLISSNYFRPSADGKELIFSAKASVSKLMDRCDTTYIQKGYEVAKEELGVEAHYIEYLLHDYRIKEDDEAKDELKGFIFGGENRLFYGVPGVGKSFAIKKYLEGKTGSVERVVFHPDYTYSDFVGQIMPTITKMTEDGQEKSKMVYRFVPGPFTVALSSAIKERNKMHYLVIEEINRGNASAIFGDIFQLLDRNEIGLGEYYITNFDIARELYGDENQKIVLPPNLTILATMNTSDQNVFTLDTAFQRRWNMTMIDNVIGKEMFNHDYMISGTKVSWGAFVVTVNGMIADLSFDTIGSEDKRLGAYFAKMNELSPNAFSEKVLKYLWEDAFRLNKSRLFNDELKTLDGVISTYEKTSAADRLEAVLTTDVYEKMVEETEKHYT